MLWKDKSNVHKVQDVSAHGCGS